MVDEQTYIPASAPAPLALMDEGEKYWLTGPSLLWQLPTVLRPSNQPSGSEGCPWRWPVPSKGTDRWMASEQKSYKKGDNFSTYLPSYRTLSGKGNNRKKKVQFVVWLWIALGSYCLPNTCSPCSFLNYLLSGEHHGSLGEGSKLASPWTTRPCGKGAALRRALGSLSFGYWIPFCFSCRE